MQLSSSHSDNRNNNFLILGEGPTYGINGSFGPPKKSLVLILLKQTQNFVWVYIVMLRIVFFFFNRNEIFKFKVDN